MHTIVVGIGERRICWDATIRMEKELGRMRPMFQWFRDRFLLFLFLDFLAWSFVSTFSTRFKLFALFSCQRHDIAFRISGTRKDFLLIETDCDEIAGQFLEVVVSKDPQSVRNLKFFKSLRAKSVNCRLVASEKQQNSLAFNLSNGFFFFFFFFTSVRQNYRGTLILVEKIYWGEHQRAPPLCFESRICHSLCIYIYYIYIYRS